MSVESLRCVHLKSWLYSESFLHVITAKRKEAFPKGGLFEVAERKGEQHSSSRKNVEYNSLRDLSPCNNGHYGWETIVTIEKCNMNVKCEYECDHYHPETIVTMNLYVIVHRTFIAAPSVIEIEH